MKNAFEGLGMKIKEMLFLSPGEAYEASKRGAYIVDIREEYETGYKAFDVEKVLYSSFLGFANRINDLPSDRYLIIADSSGTKSKEIVKFLKEKGFENVAVLNGGIINWERQEMPLKKDKNKELTGSCLCTLKTRVKRK